MFWLFFIAVNASVKGRMHDSLAGLPTRSIVLLSLLWCMSPLVAESCASPQMAASSDERGYLVVRYRGHQSIRCYGHHQGHCWLYSLNHLDAKSIMILAHVRGTWLPPTIFRLSQPLDSRIDRIDSVNIVTPATQLSC
ncbi:hypothetical protein EDD16DRAFT_1597445 [Pisolithus croceorrhizus]|nr:hypothetical protein EDD16DRAFT_1597445 [Pisolithus croceorrhizus]